MEGSKPYQWKQVLSIQYYQVKYVIQRTTAIIIWKANGQSHTLWQWKKSLVLQLRHCRRPLNVWMNWCGSRLKFKPEYVTDLITAHNNMYNKTNVSYCHLYVLYFSSNKLFPNPDSSTCVMDTLCCFWYTIGPLGTVGMCFYILRFCILPSWARQHNQHHHVSHSEVVVHWKLLHKPTFTRSSG